MRVTILLVLLFAARDAGALTPGGWDSIAFQPGSPVVDEGALVLHDDGTAVRVFSASTRRFTAVAASGAAVWGTGDWTAVVAEGANVLAYSARRNTVTALPIEGTVVDVRVEDDVAVVVAGAAPVFSAWAYSAFTGTVDFVPYAPLDGVALDLATSRFVAVLRGAGGTFGFAARTGEWVALGAVPAAGAPKADGNVGLVEVAVPGSALVRGAAFSGVSGTWSTSAPAHPGSVLVDHDVAFARGFQQTSTWFALGYSAYSAHWVSSSVVRPVTTGAAYVSDKVVAVQTIDPSPGLEALGARPGLQWAVHAPQVALHVPLGPDYLLARELAADVAVTFSGVCEGTFLTTPFTGPAFSASTSPEHSTIATDSGQALRGYSPLTHAWSPFPSPGALGPYFDDAIALALDPPGGGTQWWRAFSARSGHWTQGPAAIGASTTLVGGSYGVVLGTGGEFVGRLHVFDERCDAWQTFELGAAATPVTGRNVLLLEKQTAAHEVLAWCVQRGALEPSSGAPGALLQGPVVEENVGWFVDSAGTLHAFGAHADLHVWAQHPNGTEMQTSGVSGTAVAPSPLGVSFTGEPAENVYLLLAAAGTCEGVAVDGWAGSLCLEPSSLKAFGPLAPIGPTRLLPIVAPLGSTVAPACFEVRLQGGFVNGSEARFGVRCEPLRGH